VAGAKAYPALFCIDKNMQPLPVTARDFRIMSACSSAFLAFLSQHSDVFDAEHPAAVAASYFDEAGLMIIFKAPYE
jgi:hypothetical protein